LFHAGGKSIPSLVELPYGEKSGGKTTRQGGLSLAWCAYTANIMIVDLSDRISQDFSNIHNAVAVAKKERE
jgi:hypothetical protein